MRVTLLLLPATHVSKGNEKGLGVDIIKINLMGKWEPFCIFVGLVSYELRGAKYGLEFFSWGAELLN